MHFNLRARSFRRVPSCRLTLERLEDRDVPSAYVVNEYTMPNPDSMIRWIEPGPDGNVWVSDLGRTSFHKITPTGEITEVPLNLPGYNPDVQDARPNAFTFVPGGNIWFVNRTYGAQLVDQQGQVVAREGTVGGSARWVVTYHDDFIWDRPDVDTIEKFNVSGTTYAQYNVGGSDRVGNLVHGPDGNLWLARATAADADEYVARGIARVHPDGTSEVFDIQGTPSDAFLDGRSITGGLTAGPDGNLWLPQWRRDFPDGARLLRINTDGVVTGEFAVPEWNDRPGASSFEQIYMTAGPDGALWATEPWNNRIARIAMDGTVTEITIPSGHAAYRIASGPDGNIWFVEIGVGQDELGEPLGQVIGQIILNQPPTADAGGPYTLVRGGSVTLDASDTSDPNEANTTLTYAWDFDGDGQYDDASGMNPTFSAVGFAAGSYTIGLKVTDDGDLFDTATATVHVEVAAVLPDPANPSATALFVGGTTGNDTIVFSPVGNSGAVKVQLNGTELGSFAPTGRIIAYGQAGDDDIQVAGGISLPAWLYGDAGNDRLKGGAGHDVLLGGDGADLLVGGQGRDMVIGGDGGDRIVGDSDDDILIAGCTNFDNNFGTIAAVMDEWTSSHSYATRTANLRASLLQVDGSAATVFDDGDADVLTGSAGQDWFFAQLDGDNGTVKDKITDLGASELAADLDWLSA